MILKRWLTIFLVLAMCLSLVQVSALAITSDGTGEASESLEPIGNLQLSASELTSETAVSAPSEPNVTSAPLPEITPSPAPDATSIPEPAAESVSAPTPGPTSETTSELVSGLESPSSTVAAENDESDENATSIPVSFPSPEILAEADGVKIYSLVKVLFPCEQSENLSGLQVYNSDWQKMDPYIDPATLLPYYNIYYLSPGIYAYYYQDENGNFETIDYTPFMVEWDKPEQKFDVVLTATAPVMDQVVEMQLHSVTMVNPIYSAVVDTVDIPDASTTPEECAGLLQQIGDAIADYVDANTGNQASFSATFQASPSSVFSSADTFYKDTSSAGTALKTAMTSRKAEIKIYYQSSEELDWNTLCSNIYSNAVSHTGVPTEGDYLLYEFGGYNATGAGPVKLDGSGQYSYLFNYAPLYYTTAAQENEMTNAVNSVLRQLSLSGKTDYQKVKAIYDYLCTHVTYDNAHASNGSYTLKYTGYAALVQGTAVCQGYSVAFYRLCLEAGINTRVIDSKQMLHAWNIVHLGNKYYHLDATWDAGRSNYLYFLRGNTWWLKNHKQNGISSKGDKFSSASFSSSYPVPDSDYSEDSADPGEETHTALTFHQAVPATCITDGSLAYWTCEECGKIFLAKDHNNPVTPEALAVKALGHDYANGQCARCGESLSCQILYECNGGINAAGNPTSFTAGASDIELKAPNRSGYTFEGWYKTSSLSGTPISKITSDFTGDLTLYAKWKANTYTVVFDPNGGSGSQRTQAMTYDRQAVLTANSFRKDGSAFVGWSTNPSASAYEYADRQSVMNLTASAGETVTLYAVWSTNAYVVVFDANGGVGDMSSLGGLRNYGETYTLPACTFTRDGFRFAGWAVSARGKVTYQDCASFSNLTTTNGATVTLYAVWTAHQYSIVFDGNGATSGTMRPLENRQYGNTVTLTSNAFRRTGYTFTGWNTSPNGNGVTYSNRARQANFTSGDGAILTLYAQWSPVQYRITYRNVLESDGNSNPALYSADDPTIPLSGLSRAGNVFGGWYTDSRCSNAITSIPHGTSGNLTLYAKWSPYSYTVEFDANGGTGSMDALSGCICGRSYSLRNNAFKRTGYGFAGWNTAPDGSGSSYVNRARITSLSSENGAVVTLYAQWTPITYRINYRNVTASDINPNPTTYSSTETVVLQNISRNGYVFEGWYSDSSFRTQITVINSNLVGGAVTVYAKWTQLKYNISFDGNAQGRGNVTGTMRDLTNRLFGRTYMLTSCSYRLSGYVFLGWSTDPNSDTPAYLNRDKVTDLARTNGETVILYAIWRPAG